MRQNTVRLMLVVMLSLVSAVAYPQTVEVTEKNLGSMDYARAFMQNGPTVGYSGSLRFDTVEKNELVAHFGYLIIDQNELTSHFEVDDVVLWSFSEGDKPLAGIPFPESGQFVNLSIWLYGFTEEVGNGQTTKFGSFHTDLLLPGDPIVITMVPGSVMVPIYMTDMPQGVEVSDLALRFAGDNYATAFWDSIKERFVVWVDPLYPPTGYEIYNWRTGTVYYSAGFVLGEKSSSPTANAGLNISNVGNVVELNFGVHSYVYLANQHFQSYDWDEKTDQWKNDSVFMSYLNGRSLNLQFYGISSGEISVELVRFDGTVETVSKSLTVLNEASQFIIGAGYDKVIIKVTGTLSYSDWGYSLSAGIADGGKG